MEHKTNLKTGGNIKFTGEGTVMTTIKSSALKTSLTEKYNNVNVIKVLCLNYCNNDSDSCVNRKTIAIVG